MREDACASSVYSHILSSRALDYIRKVIGTMLDFCRLKLFKSEQNAGLRKKPVVYIY